MGDQRKRCHVYGEVEYGDKYYSVNVGGFIEEKGHIYSLVTVDEIDKDKNVTVIVNNNLLSFKKED